MQSLLIPLLGLILGICAGYFGSSRYPGILLTCIALLIYLLIKLSSRSYSIAFRLAPYHHVWIFLCLIGIGIIDYDLTSPENVDITHYDGGMAVAEVLDNTATNYGSKLTLRLVSLTDTSGYSRKFNNIKCLVNVINGYQNYERGSIITFKSNLRSLDHKPGVTTESYIRSLRNRRIIYSQLLIGDSPVIIGYDKTLSDIALDIRDRLEIFIEMSGLNHKTSAFLITALLGDRAFLNNEIRANFADAGISHILALSGMHVAIVSLIVLTTLFPFNFTGNYKLRYWIAIILLWCYAFLTGLSPSTVRAVIMATIAFLAIIFERRKSAFNALLTALFFILIFDPLALFDVGLQLGTLCVGSLIAFASYYNTVDHRSHPLTYKFISLILASIVATAGSWVLVAYYFKTFSPMFLIANIVILPLLPIYVIISVIYLLMYGIGWDFGLLRSVVDGGYSAICGFTQFLSADGSGAIHIDITPITVFIWIIGLIILATGIHLRKSPVVRTIGYSTLAVSVLSIWFL